MKKLLKAIEIRNKYLNMSLADFIVVYEKHYNEKVSNEMLEQFSFTGLNNVDFLNYMNKI